MNDTATLPRDDTGKLIAYAWPGGYPMIYVTQGEALCATCADAYLIEDLVPFDQRHLDTDIHCEGEPVTCCDCGTQIESAYGVPE